MSFWDWLTGGNAKVVARDLVDVHRRCGGNYESVMQISMVALLTATLQKDVSKKNLIVIDCIISKLIRNYLDLCVLTLYANAAPDWEKYENTYAEFSGKIRNWLIADGIPLEYVDGDNRHLTNPIVDKLREELGVN